MINFPLFSQRDSRWARKYLGESNLTLGSQGCLVACMAMISKYYGKDTDPEKLNQSLVAVGGFKDSRLYKWYEGVPKIYPDVTVTKIVNTPKPVSENQFAEIDREIRMGRPVVCEVDFIPDTARADMHFVVIIEKDGEDYIVADPWYGDRANLYRYGKPALTIQRYVFHSGPIPSTEDLVESLTDKIDEINRAFADTKRNWNEDIKAKERLEQENEELVGKWEGEKAAREDWEKWHQNIWGMLNPIGKSMTPQNTLAEIKEMINKEDSCEEQLKEYKPWREKYEKLFSKVGETISYLGNDPEGLYMRLSEALASNSAPKQPILDPDPIKNIVDKRRGGFIIRLWKYFRSQYL